MSGFVRLCPDRWLVGVSGFLLLAMLCCTSSSGVPLPTDRGTEDATIGDTTLTVEAAVYQGRVAPPAGNPVAVDRITVWSGFGGSMPVDRDRRFSIRTNRNATGLVVARDASGWDSGGVRLG